jgi:hypothetical protein
MNRKLQEARMNKRLVLVTLVALVLGCSSSRAEAPNLSGTWAFSVDLETGGHGEPTFVFQQAGEKLTGTYSGPLGEQKVTGTMKDEQAVFGFEFSQNGQSAKATYTGKMESPTKMQGTVEFSGGTRGTWSATKKAQ